MYELYNDLFDSIFGEDRSSKFNLLRTDMKENEEGYSLEIDMPGVKKEDIKLDYNENNLKVSFRAKKEQEDENNKFIRRERYYGSYSRTYYIPNIDASTIDASYNDGVLRVNLKKRTQDTVRSIEIK